jgi:ATP adenylyltransferase
MGEGGSTDPWNKPILESEHFFAVPSLGAIVPGWILVVPKRHRLSLRECRANEWSDLNFMVDTLCPILAFRYQSGLVQFEHGPSAISSAVGCGIDHAHLHVVATDIDLLSVAQSEFKDLDWKSLTEQEALLRLDSTNSYLYLRDQAGQHSVSESPDIPSQVFRKCLAVATHRPNDWNWRASPAYEVAAEVSKEMRLLVQSERQIVQ